MQSRSIILQQPTFSSNTTVYDVIVVGGGNAGFSAATTVVQTLRSLHHSSTQPTLTTPSYQPKVLLIEKAPHEISGGNTFYTAGAYRFCFDGLSDLRPILTHSDGSRNIPDSLAAKIEISPYTEGDFHADLQRVTSGRTDPDLAKVLVSKSREAVNWLAEMGGKWELSFNRQAYEVDGKFKFWGGLAVCFGGGGKGLVEWHERLAEREGVEVRYGTSVIELVTDMDRIEHSRMLSAEDRKDLEVVGVKVQSPSGEYEEIVSRGGVILATGGFQANEVLRSKWLGPTWSSAHVRGSPTNTGDGHILTIASAASDASSYGGQLATKHAATPKHNPKINAKSAGHYQGCHSVCWDIGSPKSGGSRTFTNQYTKSGYPLGIMINAYGERFVDEGADLRNYTYAIYGREVLKQPKGGVAWQIWDAKGSALLRKEEYDPGVVVNLITASESLDQLADLLCQSGMDDKEGFLRTVEEFNDACQAFSVESDTIKEKAATKDGQLTTPSRKKKFDPSRKDGLSTQSSTRVLDIPKSNWARSISEPPFTAVKITCGITFTFGGLKIVPETGEVVADQNAHDNENEKRNGGMVDDMTCTEVRRINDTERPIKGLYCCGELMGGLFWGNYPGGSGLTAGTVFGRIAGEHAAKRALAKHTET